MTSISDAASWQKPAVLRKALTVWACRDTSRPDPKARQAADNALAAINAMQDELDALYARVKAEIDDAATDQLAAATEPEPATSNFPDVAENYQSTVAALAAAGYDSDANALILTDAAAAAGTGFGYYGRQLTVTAEMRGGIPVYTVTARDPGGLASCGHRRNDDGECDCAWWPERAPAPGGSEPEPGYEVPRGYLVPVS